MKVKSILEMPEIRKEAEEIKKIIRKNSNEYAWNDLRTKHGFDATPLSEVVSAMLNEGELYEPALGYLGVVV